MTALRPLRDERRKAILEVARDIFMREGYAAASMSAIAQRVGGSKGTLYNYFPSKEAMFAALMDEECRVEAELVFDVAPDGEPRATLTELGRRYLEFVLSDRVMDVHRLVIAEASRFPELGQTFYRVGPKTGVDRVSALMQAQMAAGRLKPGDPRRMAQQFLMLLLAGLYQQRLWNVIERPTAEAMDENAASAVRVFWAAYGGDAPPPAAG